MEVGATWEFVCTPELGFGEEARPLTPANSVLVYRMTLLKCDATRPVLHIDSETGRPEL